MAMRAADSGWTVEMLDDLPDDGQRYEIIDGVLFVTASRNDVHQYIVGELFARLLAYLKGRGVGHPVGSPSDVRREDRRRNRVQPDVFVLRVRDSKRPVFPFDLADLLLAVEVESPSNPRYDYQTKRELYLKAHIPEYWIVRPETQTIVRWRHIDDPGEILTRELTWHPAGMAHAFTLDLPEFFLDALEG
jgi:Uma2 family endonuclease